MNLLPYLLMAPLAIATLVVCYITGVVIFNLRPETIKVIIPHDDDVRK